MVTKDQEDLVFDQDEVGTWLLRLDLVRWAEIPKKTIQCRANELSTNLFQGHNHTKQYFIYHIGLLDNVRFVFRKQKYLPNFRFGIYRHTLSSVGGDCLVYKTHVRL